MTPVLACPQCGAIYAKVEDALRSRADSDNDSDSVPPAEPPRQVPRGKLLGLVGLGLLLLMVILGGPLSGEYGPRNRTTNTIPTLVNAVGEGWVRFYMGTALLLCMVVLWRTRYDVAPQVSAEERAALRRARQRRRYLVMLGLLGLGGVFLGVRWVFSDSGEDAAYPPDWPAIAQPSWPWSCPDLSGQYLAPPDRTRLDKPGKYFISQPFGQGIKGTLGNIDIAISGPAPKGLRVSIASWRPLIFTKTKCRNGWVLLGEEGRVPMRDWGTGSYAEEAWARTVDGGLVGRQTVHYTSNIFGWGDVSVGSMAQQKHYFMQLLPQKKDSAAGKP